MQSRKPEGHVTRRGILIGCLGALAVGVGGTYAVFVLRGSFMDLDFSTPGAVFLLFVLVAGPNLLLRRFARRWALTQAELLTAYIMMIVASALATMGMAGFLLPTCTAPYYYATAENGWQQLLIQYMPSWASPKPSAITSFFEGGGPGTPIPWDTWLPVFIQWLPLVAGLYLVMICTMVMVRRQWMESERLVYPLTRLPIELTETKGAPAASALLRHPNMWIGFGIAFGIGSLIGLHFYLPRVPSPQLSMSTSIIGVESDPLHFRLSLPMVGFFYLATAETTLSLWVFNLLSFAARAGMDILGVGVRETLGIYGARSPTFQHLGMGAMFAMVMMGAWASRGQLKAVWLSAIGRGNGEDADEILSYRFAFWGTLVGLTVMAVWLVSAGMSWYVALYLLLLAFVLFVGLTRIVVGTGMAEAVAAAIAPSMVASHLGTALVGRHGIMGLVLAHTWCSDIRTFLMASVANSLKIVEVIPHGRRRVAWAIALATVIAVVSSVYVTLAWGHTIGGTTMSSAFFGGMALSGYQWAADKITHEPGPNLAGVGLALAGGAAMIGLTLAHKGIPGWPLHPVGFVIGGTWIMDQLWFTCLCTWGVKSIVLRYGGLSLFRRTTPFALGLILGQYTCNGAWLVVDHFMGRTDNAIFWI